MARKSYIQCPKTHKLIPKDEYYEQKARETTAAVHTFTEFRSPIDGSVISDSRKLAEHNKKHGVTNVRDYGETHFKRKAAERAQVMDASSARNKAQRIDTIKRAMHKHGLR